MAYQSREPRLPPGGVLRNHDDAALSWPGPPRCDIVVVRLRRGKAADGQVAGDAVKNASALAGQVHAVRPMDYAEISLVRHIPSGCGSSGETEQESLHSGKATKNDISLPESHQTTLLPRCAYVIKKAFALMV
jgi:hypothetical protein